VKNKWSTFTTLRFVQDETPTSALRRSWKPFSLRPSLAEDLLWLLTYLCKALEFRNSYCTQALGIDQARGTSNRMLAARRSCGKAGAEGISRCIWAVHKLRCTSGTPGWNIPLVGIQRHTMDPCTRVYSQMFQFHSAFRIAVPSKPDHTPDCILE
jgi:hypothetical protein